MLKSLFSRIYLYNIKNKILYYSYILLEHILNPVYCNDLLWEIEKNKPSYHLSIKEACKDYLLLDNNLVQLKLQNK